MTEAIHNSAQSKTVALATPLFKDGQTLTEIELCKPNAGNLRGLSLIKVMEMDFEAAQILLPRVSCLNERDVLNLETENWAPLMTELASFFVNLEQ